MTAELAELAENNALRDGREFIRASEIEKVYTQDDELRVVRHIIESRSDTELDPPLTAHRGLVKRLEAEWKQKIEEAEERPIKRRRLVKEESKLAQALLTGEEAGVRTALEDGKEDINAPLELDHDCRTPFELALERGDRNITRLLIEHGARARATPNIVVAALLASDSALVRALWNTGVKLPRTVVDKTHEIFPLCLRGHEFGVMRTLIQAALDSLIPPIDLFDIIAEYTEPFDPPRLIPLELRPPNIAYRLLAERMWSFAQHHVVDVLFRPPELDLADLEDEKFRKVCDQIASSFRENGEPHTMFVQDSVSCCPFLTISRDMGDGFFVWEGDEEECVRVLEVGRPRSSTEMKRLIDCWANSAEPWMPLCEDSDGKRP